MKIDLAVIGQGAVTPAGPGLEPLLTREPTPVPTSGLRRPEQTWPVFRVDLQDPALVRWQREPRLRRSSPVSLFLIEAAEQALAGVTSADRAQTGLIIAFSAGCLAYSRRFFEGILRQGRKMASPALFPETVFNSPGSHVASTLKLNGAVSALVGDESAWIAALKMASVWLRRGRVQQVLVLGAEEFDPVVLDAYQSARWLRRSPASFIPSEGTAGLLLRPAQPGDAAVITEVHDGFIYRHPQEASLAAEKLFHQLDPDTPCLPTTGRTWLASLEKKWMSQRNFLPNATPYYGEAFTASAAWNTLRTVAQLSDQTPALTLPLWGLNHQLGALAFRNWQKT